MWTHPGQGVDTSTVKKVDTSTGTSEEGWIHPEIQLWTHPRWVDVSICWGWMHPEVLMDASGHVAEAIYAREHSQKKAMNTLSQQAKDPVKTAVCKVRNRKIGLHKRSKGCIHCRPWIDPQLSRHTGVGHNHLQHLDASTAVDTSMRMGLSAKNATIYHVKHEICALTFLDHLVNTRPMAAIEMLKFTIWPNLDQNVSNKDESSTI
ncbi:hypothetical protein C8R45DRAFT_944002 [Mycena sanguinolenta]|nr:hypothetical protein C8R45DRAFT_944002 [Mycena sanguinolenta]